MTGVIPSYIYHCNAHTATGEASFHSLCDDFFWARSPLVCRLSELSDEVKVSVIYGEDSWVTKLTVQDLETAGVRRLERMSVVSIADARHHVYADQHQQFNSVLIRLVNDP